MIHLCNGLVWFLLYLNRKSIVWNFVNCINNLTISAAFYFICYKLLYDRILYGYRCNLLLISCTYQQKNCYNFFQQMCGFVLKNYIDTVGHVNLDQHQQCICAYLHVVNNIIWIDARSYICTDTIQQDVKSPSTRGAFCFR